MKRDLLAAISTLIGPPASVTMIPSDCVYYDTLIASDISADHQSGS